MISKAAYLVECAHFVRRCSLGQWPEWMRINMTTFRPQESFAVRPTGNMNARLNKLYQAAAARMFYIWGEVSHRDCASFSRIYQIIFFLNSSQRLFHRNSKPS